MQMLIDFRANTDVIDKGTREELKSKKIECKSQKCEKKLYACGCFEARVVLGDRVFGAELVVIEGMGQPLLERSTELGVLEIGSLINSISSDIVEVLKDSFKASAIIAGGRFSIICRSIIKTCLPSLKSAIEGDEGS